MTTHTSPRSKRSTRETAPVLLRQRSDGSVEALSSDGTTVYTLRIGAGEPSCECRGWQTHHHCKHISAALARYPVLVPAPWKAPAQHDGECVAALRRRPGGGVVEREELIVMLADVSELLRQARAAGVPPRPSCPSVCDPAASANWGAGRTCTACGGPIIPATALHQQLVSALRRVGHPASQRAA